MSTRTNLNFVSDSQEATVKGQYMVAHQTAGPSRDINCRSCQLRESTQVRAKAITTSCCLCLLEQPSWVRNFNFSGIKDSTAPVWSHTSHPTRRPLNRAFTTSIRRTERFHDHFYRTSYYGATFDRPRASLSLGYFGREIQTAETQTRSRRTSTATSYPSSSRPTITGRSIRHSLVAGTLRVSPSSDSFPIRTAPRGGLNPQSRTGSHLQTTAQ